MKAARVIAMVSLALLAACAEPGVTDHVLVDHAQGAAGTASLHADRTLAEQGGAAAGSQQDADRRASEQLAKPVLRRARSPWVGSVSVPMGSGERLPSIFTEPVKFNFDDAASGGKVGLRTMADRITAITGVPVRLKPDVFAAADAAPRPQPAVPMPLAPQLPTLPGRVAAGPKACQRCRSPCQPHARPR